MHKGKSISSKESQLLRYESRRLIGGLSKKGYDIYDFDISENESISDMWEKDLTLALKA